MMMMANDRMYIIEKRSGDKFYIAKHLMNGWYTNNDEMYTDWSNFLEKHSDEFWEYSHSYEIGYDDPAVGKNDKN